MDQPKQTSETSGKLAYSAPEIRIYGDIGKVTGVILGAIGNDGGIGPNDKTI